MSGIASFFAIKLGVTDFERSAAFYAKVFGMTSAPEIPGTSERPLQWPEAGHGPSIIMYKHQPRDHVHTVEPLGKVSADLQSGAHPFKAGTSWVVFQVDDIKATAQALAAEGREAGIGDAGPLGFNFYVVMSRYPDGNVLEVVQAY